MKRAEVTGECEAAVREVPGPEPVDDWVKLRVEAAPMCTEHKRFADGDTGGCLGHEAAGEVVATDGATTVDVGDRVAAMPLYPTRDSPLYRTGDYIYADELDYAAETGQETGRATYAQYHLKPDWLCAELPDGVSYVHGSMACCGLGPTLGACDRMDVGAGDTVLVNGLGPVGLGAVVNASYRGARVVGVEPTAYRTELAYELGADHVVDPTGADVAAEVADVALGEGADKAIECSGVPAAQRTMIDALGRRGEAAFVADTGAVDLDVGTDLVYRGITLHGNWHYGEELIPEMMRMLPRVEREIETLVTHTFPLEAIQGAFELQRSRECGKVVLEPWA